MTDHFLKRYNIHKSNSRSVMCIFRNKKMFWKLKSSILKYQKIMKVDCLKYFLGRDLN